MSDECVCVVSLSGPDRSRDALLPASVEHQVRLDLCLLLSHFAAVGLHPMLQHTNCSFIAEL